MFQSILIKNSFISKDIFIEFEDGLNILSAKNGFGKSTILEMLNYSLFGTQALRSSISDYPKNFEVICKIIINSVPYTINRTVKNSFITQDEEIIVTGITPVNLFIKELLNYDYKIFSLTNFVQQQNLLNLTSCTPAVLTELIETISGINSSEKLEIYLKEKLTEIRVEKKSLLATKNTSDLNNSSFKISEEFETLLNEDKDYLNTLQKSIKILSEENLEIKNLISVLTSYLNSYREILKNFQSFENYIELSSEELTTNLIEIQKLNSQLQNDLKYKSNIFKPEVEYELSFLELQENLINKNKEYSTYIKLKTELENHFIECPNCNHKFYNNEYPLEDIEKPEAAILSLKEINIHKQWLENKESYYNLEKSIQDIQTLLNELPSLEDIQNQLKLFNEYDSLQKKQIELIKNIKNTISSINIKYRVKINDTTYENLLVTQIEILREKYKDFSENIELFNTSYIDIVKYTADKKAYQILNDNIMRIDSLIQENQVKFDNYNILLKTLLQVKKQIQSDTLPRINLLASDLIKSITNGERSSIKITNDFKIEVDGKSINVVEVSAQVITNISLRIALLDTFYRDNFLVFIGDEVDAPLHEDRFNYLEDCLYNLAKMGYQIILVSHKEFNIGNNINLHKL